MNKKPNGILKCIKTNMLKAVEDAENATNLYFLPRLVTIKTKHTKHLLQRAG